MSAVCPACGVGVVPGMVRCPKCGAGLPRSKRAATQVEGGTALPTAAGFPVVPAAIGGAAVVAIIAYLALRGGPAKPVAADEIDAGAEADEVAPTPVAADEAPSAPTQPAGGTAVDPGPAIRTIEAGLRREKLWGTVTIEGDRVDVRSGGCGDAAMPAVLDGAAAGLHEAGLTTLRCLEQGGRVVFERGL